MKDLQIVFMGTPDFAVTILKQLITNNYNVVGVVTAPDKPAGRGRKLNESAVKKYAKTTNIPIFQPTNLKNESFIEQLKKLNVNLQIVVAFRMLPKKVWQLPKLGTFNLHASLLPDYRGAAPIHWAIINGETETGVSTFFIDEKIDTGAIILKSKTKISTTETVGSLHDKLMILGANLVLKTVDIITNKKVNTTLQPIADGKLAPKLTKENTKIDWQDTLDNIYNKIRGLNPFPSAWTTIINNGKPLEAKIYSIDKEISQHNYKLGKIVYSKTNIKIAVKEGFIIVNEIKLSGKRKMDTKSLLNGFTFSDDAHFI